MGNSKSLPFEPFINGAPLIHVLDDFTIVKKLHHSSVVRYTLLYKVQDRQLLSFDNVHTVGKFKCLTNGAKFDILIDGEIHYKDVEDLTLVLIAMEKNEITIRTYTDEPIVISCMGYSFDYSTRIIVASRKLKTNTSRYSLGRAKKIK